NVSIRTPANSTLDTSTPGVVTATILGKTWTGGGANTNWDNPANWDGGVPDSSDSVAIGTGGTNVKLNVAATVGNVTLNRGADMTIDGPGALTIGGGVKVKGVGNYSINCPVILGADQTWDHTGAGTVIINGTINGEANFTKSGTGELVVAAAN